MNTPNQPELDWFDRNLPPSSQTEDWFARNAPSSSVTNDWFAANAKLSTETDNISLVKLGNSSAESAVFLQSSPGAGTARVAGASLAQTQPPANNADWFMKNAPAPPSDQDVLASQLTGEVTAKPSRAMNYFAPQPVQSPHFYDPNLPLPTGSTGVSHGRDSQVGPVGIAGAKSQTIAPHTTVVIGTDGLARWIPDDTLDEELSLGAKRAAVMTNPAGRMEIVPISSAGDYLKKGYKSGPPAQMQSYDATRSADSSLSTQLGGRWNPNLGKIAEVLEDRPWWNRVFSNEPDDATLARHGLDRDSWHQLLLGGKTPEQWWQQVQADIQNQNEKELQTYESAARGVGKAVKGVVIDLPKAVYHAATDPVGTQPYDEPGTSRGIGTTLDRLLISPQKAILEKGRNASTQSERIGYSIAGGLPVFGPLAAQLGEDIGKDPVQGISEAVGYSAVPEVAKKAWDTLPRGKLSGNPRDLFVNFVDPATTSFLTKLPGIGFTAYAEMRGAKPPGFAIWRDSYFTPVKGQDGMWLSRKGQAFTEPQLEQIHGFLSEVGDHPAVGNMFVEQPPGGPLVTLRSYGGAGGGHHVVMKRLFFGILGHDTDESLAIPNDELKRLDIEHEQISTNQMQAYKDFGKTDRTLTWDDVERIETKALIDAKMDPAMAKYAVQRAIQHEIERGITQPAWIPWKGPNPGL